MKKFLISVLEVIGPQVVVVAVMVVIFFGFCHIYGNQ